MRLTKYLLVLTKDERGVNNENYKIPISPNVYVDVPGRVVVEDYTKKRHERPC
jgi:hypothetical protein